MLTLDVYRPYCRPYAIPVAQLTVSEVQYTRAAMIFALTQYNGYIVEWYMNLSAVKL